MLIPGLSRLYSIVKQVFGLKDGPKPFIGEFYVYVLKHRRVFTLKLFALKQPRDSVFSVNFQNVGDGV